MRLIFVGSTGGNEFMNEILAALRYEVELLSCPTEMRVDRYGDHEAGDVYITVPHEYFATTPQHGHPTEVQRAATIGLGVEMPGTPWFDYCENLCHHLGAAVSINHSAVAELRRRGVAATHLQLGYHEPWDRWRGRDDPRGVDVVYLGSADDRRGALLAAAGRDLYEWNCRFLVPPVDPKTEAAANFLVGSDKHDLLRQSRTLINLHRGASRSFEWVRALEAICNGCVVVTEYSYDIGPLDVGHHLLATAPEGIGAVVATLLHDEDRRRALADAAYQFVRDELPMRLAAAHLLERAAELPAGPRYPQPPHTVEYSRPQPIDIVQVTRPTTELDLVRVSLRHLTVQQKSLQRQVQQLAARTSTDADTRGVRLVARSTASAERATSAQRTAPAVAIIIPVHNYESEVLEALASAARQTNQDIEIVAIDDASHDGSLETMCQFVDAHPHLDVTVLACAFNVGVARARNLAVSHSSADLLLMLDADNRLLPTAVERLRRSLVEHPRAAFAYPMLAAVRADQPCGLVSSAPWQPAALRSGNYIDTLAMIRRVDFEALGGYCEDPRVEGLEDFDLWCRMADRGATGIHVAQILADYRQHDHSLSSVFKTDQSVAISIIASRSPHLFKPTPPPESPTLGPVAAAAGPESGPLTSP